MLYKPLFNFISNENPISGGEKTKILGYIYFCIIKYVFD